MSNVVRREGISNPLRFAGQYFDAEAGCTVTDKVQRSE